MVSSLFPLRPRARAAGLLAVGLVGGLVAAAPALAATPASGSVSDTSSRCA